MLINPQPFEPTPRRALTQKEKLSVLLSQQGKCAACKERFALVDLEFDHVLPIALGGSNDLANFEALCGPCHRAKTAGDVKRIRKADRQRRAYEGTKPQRGPKLKGGKLGRYDPLHWRHDP